MIICCHSVINRQWDEQELADKLAQLPPDLQQAALRKLRWADKQLFIAGKLLIKETLKQLGFTGFNFRYLEYNSYKRPYIDGSPDFNISHSGDHVICCGAETGMVGIDIQAVSPIHLDEYPDYFTKNEWHYINDHTDRYTGFFNLWTRKEAILKAIGTGFHTPLDSVDVVEDVVVYDDITYYIQPVTIAPAYPCHIASTVKDEIKLIPIGL